MAAFLAQAAADACPADYDQSKIVHNCILIGYSIHLDEIIKNMVQGKLM